MQDTITQDEGDEIIAFMDYGNTPVRRAFVETSAGSLEVRWLNEVYSPGWCPTIVALCKVPGYAPVLKIQIFAKIAPEGQKQIRLDEGQLDLLKDKLERALKQITP